MLRKSIIATQLALLFAITGCGGGSSTNATSTDSTLTTQSSIDTTNPEANDAHNMYRSIDGADNNLNNPNMNAAFAQLRRITAVTYDDGIAAMPTGRPNPRTISENIHAQGNKDVPSIGLASDLIWQFAQILDHDIGITEGIASNASEPVIVPAGDSHFSVGTVLPFNRALFDSSTGTGTDNPRQQENEISGWIDASFVYGSDEIRAAALRSNDGTGKLKISEGNLMPYNISNLPNANSTLEPTGLFLAGDVRANEQAGLIAIHTLFMREHNRLAEIIAAADSSLSGEEIYQKARSLVGAMVQRITYKEFIPLLIGEHTLSEYRGYDDSVDARMINEFSHAGYRVGHTMLSPQILRIDQEGNEIPEGHLNLFAAFFNIATITQQGGIDPVLRGLANQVSQNVDQFIIDDVRNMLFANVEMGMDLATLNIQRGRDHGLGTLNDVREALGLERHQSFADVTSNEGLRSSLENTYAFVDDIDLFTGVLSEDIVYDGLVGETNQALFKFQFEALRDGDYYFYLNQFKSEDDGLYRDMIRHTTLSKIITRNTDIAEDEIGPSAFFVGDEKFAEHYYEYE